MSHKRGISRILISIIIIIIVVLGVVGGIWMFISSQKASIQKITIVTSPPGTSAYSSTEAIISAIGYIPNVQLIHQAGGGPGVQADMLRTGEADIVQTDTSYALNLWNSGFKEVRALLPVAFFPLYVVVLPDSPIKSWHDLDGKIVNIGPPAYSIHAMFLDFANATGIKPAKATELGHEDAIRALIAGQIDAYWQGAHPNPTLQQYAVKYQFRLVPPTEDEIKAMLEKYPGKYVRVTVDCSNEKVYAHIDTKFDTVAIYSFLYTTTKLPQDLVYKLVRNYWENKTKIAEQLFIIHKYMSINDMFKVRPIPLHAGVVQYFKEKGISVPSDLIPPEYKA